MIKPMIFVLCLMAHNTFAQTERPTAPVVTADGTVIVFPDGYSADRQYPLVYLLPYTKGTAAGLLSMWVGWQKEPVEVKFQKLLKTLYPTTDERQRKEFIAVVPPEVGHVDGDDWNGWEITIDRWEKKIMADLDAFLPTYGIDPRKIVLVGFSLGADLSWALPFRNTELYAGAVVMGSHCSYGFDEPVSDMDEKGNLAVSWHKGPTVERLEKNGFRFVLTMGANEDDSRVTNFNEGKARLELSKIKYLYKVVPNKAHHAATPDILKESLDYILFP